MWGHELKREDRERQDQDWAKSWTHVFPRSRSVPNTFDQELLGQKCGQLNKYILNNKNQHNQNALIFEKT